MDHAFPAASTRYDRPRRQLLIVEPSDSIADAMEKYFRAHVPRLDCTRCSSIATARAYLSGTSYDAVLAADELPDGRGLELLEVKAALGLETHLFLRTSDESARSSTPVPAGVTAGLSLTRDAESVRAAADAITRAIGIDGVDEGASEEPDRTLASEDVLALLEALRAETGAVAHAINNPLTVIAGNAQLLLEAATAEGLGPTVIGPIEDISEATARLSEALGRLADLRQRIARALGTSDGIG